MGLLRHTNNSVIREISYVFSEPFRLDYRSLALFRIMLGSIIIADLVMRCRDFQAFFTDSGIFPREIVVDNAASAVWSLYFINGTEYFAAFLILINFIFALFFILGYKTRISTVICWVLLMSLQNQGLLNMSAADALMRVLLFWGIFLPLGARFSIDSALEVRSPYPYANHLSITTFAMVMQVLYVYWVGAFLKSGDAWVSNYQAVYYALNIEHYTSLFGDWVLMNLPFTLEYLTRFVYLIELYGPLLIIAPVFWKIFRTPILILLILMHIGFVLLLNVGHFPFVSITSLIILLPTSVWDSIKSKVNPAKHRGITIYYDKGCEFCKKISYILRALLYLPKINIEPAQDHYEPNKLLEKYDSWVIEDENGRHYIEWHALCWLFSKSPIFFWLNKPMRLIGKFNLGNKIYHYIGNRRSKFGRYTQIYLPWRETNSVESRTMRLFVLLCMIITLQINLSYITILRYPVEPVNSFVLALGLGQKWSMFASYPMTKTKWPIIEAVDKKGDVIDLYNFEFNRQSTYDKPEDSLNYYKNYRWRKYFEFLLSDDVYKYSYRSAFVVYLCRKWDLQHSSNPDEKLSYVMLKEGFEKTLLDRTKEITEIKEIGEYDCDGKYIEK